MFSRKKFYAMGSTNLMHLVSNIRKVKEQLSCNVVILSYKPLLPFFFFRRLRDDEESMARIESLHKDYMATVWKVSKYGVISGPYSSVFGLNTEIYLVNLHIQFEDRKIRTRNNSGFGHFSRSIMHRKLAQDRQKWVFLNWILFIWYETQSRLYIVT